MAVSFKTEGPTDSQTHRLTRVKELLAEQQPLKGPCLVEHKGEFLSIYLGPSQSLA